jgi:hypothetical protein
MALTGTGNDLCFFASGFPRNRAVLCQEVAVVSTTTLSVSTWTVTQGISTITRTATILLNPRNNRRRGRFEPQQGRNLDTDAFDFKARKPSNCTNRCPSGLCDEVCAFQHPTLRIVNATVPYSQADEVCRRHKWRLAAVTSGIMAEVVDLFALCFGSPHRLDFGLDNLPNSLWIGSYNGVMAAACNIFMTDPITLFNSGAAFALSAEICNRLAAEERTFVLCQTDGLEVAASDGGYVGQPTTTTTTTRSTVMELTPSTTTTVTLTVTEKCCKKHKKESSDH